MSLDRAYVRFNGRIAKISGLGGAFYRDVAPGSRRLDRNSAE
jgi:hypothetical protein